MNASFTENRGRMNWHRIRHYPYRRAVRHLYQRLTRGWDDSQTYSLDYSLGQIIAPRLSRPASPFGMFTAVGDVVH